MRAVAVYPAKREVHIVDHPEPAIASATQAKMRVLDVGVCGTDRDIVGFEYGTPPEGNRRIASLVPGARYEEIAEARHFPNVEHPEMFNRIMMDWLRSL